MNNKIFYNIEDDLKAVPEAAVFIVIGGRGTGKTYSTLKYCYTHGEKFLFLKRTDTDVKMLCGSNKMRGLSMDVSPFKSLNHDIGSNVRAVSIFDGFGGFYDCGPDDKPIGDPVGYILSFNRAGKIKGFDMSDCNYIIFDEFIPLPYERVNRKEGIELLDLYRTVGRANNIKYGTVLKLICLANPTTVSCPIINEFELADTIAKMSADNVDHLYIEDRGIFIRIVPDIEGFRAEEEKNPIYKAMRGTEWARMSLDNEFAYNDFTNVKKISLKRYACLIRLTRKQKTYYIYVGNDGYYMTYRRSNHYTYSYDLNLENDQKKFYYDYVLDLRSECIDGRMKFETYEMYDLIVNYKDFYKI